MEKLEYKKTGTSRKRKAVEDLEKEKNTKKEVKRSKKSSGKSSEKEKNKTASTNKKNKSVALVSKKKSEIKNKSTSKEEHIEVKEKNRVNNKGNNRNNKNKKNTKLKEKTNFNSKSKRKTKVLITFLIIGFVGVSMYLLCTLPYFSVETININGTYKYTAEEIAEKGSLKKGRNIFVQMFKGISSSVTELPYVKSASVKINLPNKIEISVIERTPYFIAFDKDKNTFYKIDEEGYILEQVDINEKKDELLTYGFIFDDEVVFGRKLKEVDISKINIYANVKKEFENSNINGKITKVNFENSLTTITLNDKLNVIFPNDTDIKYKMSFFKSILEKIGEDSVGVIDMTKTDPVYSIF